MYQKVIFSAALLFILACSKEEIRPDPVRAIDEGTGRFECAQGSFIWNGVCDPVANIGRSTLSDTLKQGYLPYILCQ
jgi:hypothetical protein